jgi:SOS-response transcriptional repressor LexA
MQDVGINDKDYAVFRSQSDVDSGEIAVILLDSGMDADSTVKRLIKRDGKVILRAENPTFHPQEQIFTKNDPTIRVLGKAIAAASFCQE